MKQCPVCNHKLNVKESLIVVLLSQRCPACDEKLKNESMSAIILLFALTVVTLVKEAVDIDVEELYFWVALSIVGSICLVYDVLFSPLGKCPEVKSTKQMIMELKCLFFINNVAKSIFGLIAILALVTIAIYNLVKTLVV